MYPSHHLDDLYDLPPPPPHLPLGDVMTGASAAGVSLALISNLLYTWRNVTIKTMERRTVQYTDDLSLPDKKRSGAFKLRDTTVILVGCTVYVIVILLYSSLFYTNVIYSKSNIVALGGQIWTFNGSDWPPIGQIRDFFRSDFS